ncbi:MAG: DUF4173 domain-containing protein [Gaiellaceae bacterium]
MRTLALLAALTGAALLPDAPLGVNVPIVAAFVAATVASEARRSLGIAVFGGLALVLACVPALLDAGWIIALDLTAAWLLATIAVAGRRILAPLAPFRALRTVPALADDLPRGSLRALRASALGLLVSLPFAALFWTADAAFAEVGRSVPLPSTGTLPGRILVFALVLLVALGLALASRHALPEGQARPNARIGLLEWVVPLVLLDALFAIFVAVQAAVLFGGHDHVLRTSGLTYAEYARGGFWQLIAASTLTLVVVAIALRFGDAQRPSQALLRKALLGVLCVLTIVTVVSAIHRLGAYEDAFGLTRLRLAAETFAWGLGAFFALLIAAGSVRPAARLLPEIAVAGAALGLLAFSLSNPDRRIAERNVDLWRETGKLDTAYLGGLSADAVPALVELPAELRRVVLPAIERRLAEAEPWISANLARERARNLLASTP